MTKKIININELTDEQLAEAEKKLGEQLSPIAEMAIKKANKILGRYGLKAVINFEIQENIQEIES